MALLDSIRNLFGRKSQPSAPPAAGPVPAPLLPGEIAGASSERGIRANPEDSLRYAYRRMWVDPDLRAAIIDIRRMDALDGRVKKIHQRTARAAAKGGVLLHLPTPNKRLSRMWEAFARRLHLYRREKLESDVRGLMMEGNLPMQWILGGGQVVGCARMPAETIVPLVTPAGRFQNPAKAYEQWDLANGAVVATFGLWQLTVGRVGPANYDDWGSLGRPYLDASRTIWQKLTMTEEDLVIRRTMRAPLRMVHVLEGATSEQLAEYRQQVEADQSRGNYSDYYLNRKGSVSPVQGDASLDQIADVAHLLDGFFAGAPAPKGLFGYVGDLARDVLEDLKKDYYEELDALQDNVAYVYEQGFRLELLLAGINPDAYEFTVQFAERRTDTPNQRADLALKLQGLGASTVTCFEHAGLDVAQELSRLEEQHKHDDPYPEGDEGGGPPEPPAADEDLEVPPRSPGGPRVSITPGNQRKGESGTTISNR
jgi:hypothetical protein